MRNPLTVVSEKIVHSLEDFFGWYGEKVAGNPIKVIVLCLVVTAIAAIGVINYREENNAFKLWIPDNSDFVANNDWLETNAPLDIRFNSMIVAAPGANILTPQSIQHLSKLKKQVDSLVTEGGLTWDTQCFRRDVPKFFNKQDIPPYPGICGMLDFVLDDACFEQSLLEFWPVNFDFDSLTQELILSRINGPSTVSSIYKTPINIVDYLGGAVTRDDKGLIVSAEASFMRWFGHVNISNIDTSSGNMGTGELVDEESLEWEAALQDMLLADQDELPAGLETFVNVARAYGDVAGDTIVNDAVMMPIGFMIVFVYVTIMLGKFSCTEQRALLGI